MRHLEETKESWRIPEAGRVLRFISFTLSLNYIEVANISWHRARRYNRYYNTDILGLLQDHLALLKGLVYPNHRKP